MVVPRGVVSLAVQGGASSGLLWTIRHGAYLAGGVSFKDKRKIFFALVWHDFFKNDN